MSDTSSATDFPYLHGFSPTEQARLVKQARLAESTIFHDIDYSGVRRLLEVGSAAHPVRGGQHRRWRQAESSERPLRRRAARIARPARVRMRRRKPCVLARRRCARC